MHSPATFHILSLFPESLASYLEASLMKRAISREYMRVNLVNLRNYTQGAHRTADDSPYGGGPGMVLKVEPIYKAIRNITRKLKNKKTRIILFSTRGKMFTHKDAKRLAKYQHIIFICGRYEGVDERVAEHIADEELSIGEYVLSGGELPALVVMEAVSRHIPGVLGKKESLEEIKGSYPVYTRPETFSPKKGAKWRVPAALLSGDHKKIAVWRTAHGTKNKKQARN